ncbi:hypothetical protein [Brevibacillus laterosporus]|uniref:Uncharacterized protein n=1 Tax=Brevibacillus laterosporus TaxID=1465 RepID=A0AAP3G9B7_BRELA|nr:hypothetical protein [Brevibacillus laterosporus]MCR8982293.1 hypothetical protein [Brevibacillus laterosporus]MCZ0809448.1 hypothetical protein [Brevibacillus laterosporus]MCZ0827837.1 hypothetical protein [Brevibacillus laterosporus]MCZ0851777.1 hypothetical protein [Brevibacillus laterosporus]
MKSKKVGEILLEKFNKAVGDPNTSLISPLVRAVQAIPVIEESPMPSFTFTTFGIHPQSSVIPSSLKLSVKMQDEALVQGTLHRVNFGTVDASTQVIVERGTTYKHVREQMKKVIGRDDWELFYQKCVSDARLRESLYVDLLSGVPMGSKLEMKTLHALAKRLVTRSKTFRDLLTAAKADIKNEVDVCHFIYRWGFDKFAREVCSKLPFFNRRVEYCEKKGAIEKPEEGVSHSQNGLDLTALNDHSITMWLLSKVAEDSTFAPEIKTVAKRVLAAQSGRTESEIEKTADVLKQAKVQRKERLSSERKRLNAKVRLYADLVGIPYSTAWTDFSKLYESVHGTKLRQAKARHAIAIGVNSVTYPEYLEATKKLSEGIAVAEMLIARYAS